MDLDKIKKLERFIYEKLPDVERDRVILIVDGKNLSWKSVLEELKKGGALGSKIEEKLEELIE